VSTVSIQDPKTTAEPADDDAFGRAPSESQPTNSERLEHWASYNLTLIRWGVTVNLGNYESARLDCEAILTAEHNPSETLALLQMWVREHAPVGRDDWQDLLALQRQQRAEVADLESKVRQAREQWETVRSFMARHDIPLPATLLDELPF